MKRLFHLLLFGAFFWLYACQTAGTNIDETTLEALPDPKDRINDYEELLTPEQENQLSALIAAYEAETGNRIVVVTTENVAPFPDMYDYGKALGAKWELGQDNRSLLVILSKNLREVRLARELGEVPVLTETEAMRITDQIMIPLFKDNKYYQGLEEGLIALTKAWR